MRATVAAAVFAAASALFASLQVVIAQDTEKRQLRPYIEADLSEPLQIEAAKGSIYASVNIENFGETPAYDVEVIAIGDVNAYAANLEKVSGKSQDQSVFPPHQKMPIVVDIPVSDVQSVRWFYIRGRAKYRDIFQESHASYFCILVDVANMREVGDRGLRGARLCQSEEKPT